MGVGAGCGRAWPTLTGGTKLAFLGTYLGMLTIARAAREPLTARSRRRARAGGRARKRRVAPLRAALYACTRMAAPLHMCAAVMRGRRVPEPTQMQFKNRETVSERVGLNDCVMTLSSVPRSLLPGSLCFCSLVCLELVLRSVPARTTHGAEASSDPRRWSDYGSASLVLGLHRTVDTSAAVRPDWRNVACTGCSLTTRRRASSS